MRQIKRQQEQQKLIGAIALQIRQSLKLQDILATSVQEVRQLLKSDRVLVYQFTPRMQGGVVAESRGAGESSMCQVQSPLPLCPSAPLPLRPSAFQTCEKCGVNRAWCNSCSTLI